MKNFKIKIILVLGLLLTLACEDYLDIAPESVLTQEEVFSTFDNAQGFVEEMYAFVVSYGTAGHSFQNYLMGDDAYNNQFFKYNVKIDQGDLANWTRNTLCYLGKNVRIGDKADLPRGDTNDNRAKARPRVWRASMEGIRKANLALESEDLMVGLTQEEKNVILGQAYFFRAFFHNEIMKFWGRFPHIQEVFTGAVTVPRPESYKEVALSINEDYKKAIELLPVNWDNESYGERTLGQNAGRVTKGAAYAFQGKNLLLAASPLMFFNNQPGINTYSYDTELAAMAVDAFAEVLKLENAGVYQLAPWETYNTVFWNNPQNTWPGLVEGAREFIFAAPGASSIGDNASFMAAGMPRDIAGTGTQGTSPTHNYIYNNFGMANGLSIEDDLSGKYGPTTYSATRPFEGRDPRFYEWIFVDRDTIATRASVARKNRVFELFVDDGSGNTGNHRKTGFSETGYMFKKYYPKLDDGDYHVNNGNNIIRRYTGMLLHMRLTDVYLMYAEALHVARGATAAPSSFSLTAEQAINKIRNRAGLPNVNPAIVSDNNKFMDELRRERSVELAFEAHRWVDIRRWGVAHLPEYRNKTQLRFDKGWTFFEEATLIERVCEYPKHYWMPFEANQTQFYENFPQNPGW